MSEDMPSIIGGSAGDRMIGILIERTEVLRAETKGLRDVTGDLRDMYGKLSTALERFSTKLDMMERQPISNEVAVRLDRCERAADEWDKLKVWTLRIAIAALIVGGGGGLTIFAKFLAAGAGP